MFGSMGFDMLLGRPLGETVAGNTLASGALFAAALAGAKVTVPAAIVSYFLLNSIGGNLFNQTGLQNTELGGFRFQTPLSDLVDNIFGRNYENSAAAQRQRLISQQPDNMNPAPVVINNSSTDTSAVQQATAGGNGSANNIPFVPSGNSSNFHLLYSQLQYNVVG
tara:strand:- start:158 stop:652 length:495 start_codon:yes stop_codon:yes gene_type:complete